MKCKMKVKLGILVWLDVKFVVRILVWNYNSELLYESLKVLKIVLVFLKVNWNKG